VFASPNLKMEPICSSAVSVNFYQITRRHIQEINTEDSFSKGALCDETCDASDVGIERRQQAHFCNFFTKKPKQEISRPPY
jgi:hypothetical protein